MQFVFDDGGRQAAGYQGQTGDCVCRAICIATGQQYKHVYDMLAAGNQAQRIGKNGCGGVRSARNGISTTRKWFKQYMQSLGFVWVPTMRIGQGCTVHLNPSELPSGRLVVAVSKHMCAVIDGVLHDTHDCSRGGTRCVYGYYILNERPAVIDVQSTAQ